MLTRIQHPGFFFLPKLLGRINRISINCLFDYQRRDPGLFSTIRKSVLFNVKSNLIYLCRTIERKKLVVMGLGLKHDVTTT